jgi:hypothetical protein
MHEIRDAGDRFGGDPERRDQDRVRLRRRRNRDGVPVLDVVEDADGGAPLVRLADRAADDRGRLRSEVKVVLGDLE